jgi:DNA-binding NarL/FixJ family response regulator
MPKIYVAYINADNRYTQEEMRYYDNLSKNNMPHVKFDYFQSIESFFPKLSNPNYKVDFICVDVEFLQKYSVTNPYALVATLRTLAHSTLYRDSTGKAKIRNPKIIGIVGHDSQATIIKEMLPLVDTLGMRMSNLWTGEMVLENQKKLLEGDMRVPKQIQCLLRKNKRKVSNEIKLTPRQKQVVRMVIKSGASNKIIARTLNISESTVKLHIGAILKKYGLRNRTQLAVYVKDQI